MIHKASSGHICCHFVSGIESRGNLLRHTKSTYHSPLTYNKLTQRDKANLDMFWLRDESREDYENLPHPETIAAEITENLEYALEQFTSIQEDLTESRD